MLKSHLRFGKQVNLLTRKKIVFVIVEGPSEDDALGLIFTKFFKQQSVHVEIIHGDITVNPSIHPVNIATKITDILKRYAQNTYRAKDFACVIHLMDTDGAYIPDSAVKKDASRNHPYYTTSEIWTSNPDGIRQRNQHKRENMDRLARLRYVWRTIPYAAYYMSSNLDHVLYNQLNTSDIEKEDSAFAFARKYKNNVDEFLTFLCNSKFSVCTSYLESWKFIREELHSLERYTNLGLGFQKFDFL